MDKQELKEILAKKKVINRNVISDYHDGQNAAYEHALDLIDQLDEPDITELDALNRLAEKVPLSADDIARHLAKLTAYNGKVAYGYNEPETLSQEWIEKHTEYADAVSESSYKDVAVVRIDKLQNLLVPKQELPVIPQFVAKKLERYGSLQKMLVEEHYAEGTEEIDDDTLADWIDKNFKTLCKAESNGYTVEEKKYEVKDKNDCFLLTKNSEGEVINAYSKVVYKNKGQLTEQEIKDYDERFWTFAVPVEEGAEK